MFSHFSLKIRCGLTSLDPNEKIEEKSVPFTLTNFGLRRTNLGKLYCHQKLVQLLLGATSTASEAAFVLALMHSRTQAVELELSRSKNRQSS